MKFKIPPEVIIKYLEDNFGEVRQTSTGELRVNSPFSNDKKFHLYVNPEKAVFHDFKTGIGGTFYDLVQEVSGIQKNSVLKYMAQNYSFKAFQFSFHKEETTSKLLQLPNGVHYFYENVHGIIRDAAYNYLKRRRIPENIIDTLGYIHDPGSEFDRRIFIPFYEDNILVYFIARDFTNNNFLRYKNPSGINSKEFVYNIDEIKDEVFIFEGVFDALMLNTQVGTAMLSADLSKKQAIKILDKAPKKIIFVPDNDDTGRNTLEKNINTILQYKPNSLRIEIFVYEITGVKDFSETGMNFIDIKKCKKWRRYDLSKIFLRRNK